MAARTGLSITPVQRLALTPGMRHRLQVLRLPLPELSEELAAEAADNPLLTYDAPIPIAPMNSVDMIDQLAAPRSLAAHLLPQIGLMRLSDPVRQAAELVVWSLNEDGYLDAPAPELAQDTGMAPDLFAQGLAALQACDPAGVGAQDLTDCLRLQLLALEHAPDIVARALPVLDQLATGGRTALTGATPTESAALRALARDIPRLDPRPGQRFAPDLAPVLPDLILRLDGGRWQLDLAYRLTDALHLDEPAWEAARSDPEAARFLAPHRDRAHAVRRAVADRESSVLRIARALVSHQIGWFTDGPAALRPLTRRDLADTLGLHPATLSRALGGKTLAHARGVVPLDALFSTAIPGAAGAALSAVQVQTRLRQIIADEPADAPLSDAALARELAAEQIDIARRTVAKYRGCLNIPPSHIRKRLRARTGLRGSAPSPGPVPSRRS